MKNAWRDTLRWATFIFGVTFFLSGALNASSTAILDYAAWWVGLLVVIVIVFIGIIFDIMGLAAAAAREAPYHAIAAERVSGARQAISIVRNAEKFSNFCNDVVGDIASVLSGAATAAVVVQILLAGQIGGLRAEAVAISATAMVAAVTVGGKALGKAYAIRNANFIILQVGKFFAWLDINLHIRLFAGNDKKKPRKRGGKRAAGKRQYPR
jgi:CBS domain containing-hemolysin-like protein